MLTPTLKLKFDKHCLESSKLHAEIKAQKDTNPSNPNTLDLELSKLKEESQLYRIKIDECLEPMIRKMVQGRIHLGIIERYY